MKKTLITVLLVAIVLLGGYLYLFRTDDSPVIVTSPKNGEVIASPITINGKAIGPWYFEASFPIVIVDQGGNMVGQGHAEAQGEWMTTEYVPFIAKIEFTKPAQGGIGKIILKNDNPSGDPERDRFVEINIKF